MLLFLSIAPPQKPSYRSGTLKQTLRFSLAFSLILAPALEATSPAENVLSIAELDARFLQHCPELVTRYLSYLGRAQLTDTDRLARTLTAYLHDERALSRIAFGLTNCPKTDLGLAAVHARLNSPIGLSEDLREEFYRVLKNWGEDPESTPPTLRLFLGSPDAAITPIESEAQ